MALDDRERLLSAYDYLNSQSPNDQATAAALLDSDLLKAEACIEAVGS